MKEVYDIVYIKELRLTFDLLIVNLQAYKINLNHITTQMYRGINQFQLYLLTRVREHISMH